MSEKLKNPFWTSGLVNQVDQFFGRGAELDQLEENIVRGGIAICGPVGIGKSSLLSRLTLMLEGFDAEMKAVCITAMCSKGNEPWELARKLCNQFRRVTQKRVKERGFDLQGAIWKDTVEDRELSGDEYITAVYELLYEISREGRFDYIVVQFDECHSCAPSLASLIRELKEQLEHAGVSEIRFITAGIGAYMNRMLEANAGIGRALQNRFDLIPWSQDETIEFIESKFDEIRDNAATMGLDISIEGTSTDDLPNILYNLSGGHPFLAQLLGAYLIRHENSDPDGVLSPRDLVGAMKEICTRTRKLEYDQMIGSLEEAGMLAAYRSMVSVLDSREPSRVRQSTVKEVLGDEAIQWLEENGFIFSTAKSYQLTDELLRVSLMLREDSAVARREERKVLRQRREDE